jgi:hypothetical protein
LSAVTNISGNEITKRWSSGNLRNSLIVRAEGANKRERERERERERAIY